MAEFVDDDVVHDRRGRQYAAPVEIQCVVECAGSPTFLLFFDVDLFGLDTELNGVVVDTFLDFVDAFLLVPVDHVGA